MRRMAWMVLRSTVTNAVQREELFSFMSISIVDTI